MQGSASHTDPQVLHEQLCALDPSTYTERACTEIATVLDEIHALKRERNAVILAHNYQRPELFAVADFVGDSLELARQATRVDADVIVFCGVHFMAETAKILNPSKRVLLPDLRAGCSLADSATGDALAARKAELRRLYPDLAVVGYVNTTAEVKAECDVCCTSSNAVRIVEALPTNDILFVPDENLARYVQQETRKNVIAWDGNCYVSRPSRVPGGRDGPGRRRAQHERHGTLREGEPGDRVPHRHRVRPLRSPADGGAGEALLQELQAVPVHEDDHRRGNP
jgi:quinolinate synthase